MFNRAAGLIAFLLVISVPLFLHLDRWPFRLWDESRLAANAYEMHTNGNLIVTHYDGQPEMWNTKPPMMIWLQTASIKIFGFNELAVRLPSAIAGLLTCLSLLFLSKKISGDYLTGTFASFVLVTTNGYVDAHAVRTGDYDALLTLFTTLFVLAAFIFSENGNRKWINLFFGATVLAILTKSVQGLLFLPGIGLYFLVKRKNIFSAATQRQKTIRHFLIGAIVSILVASSYYLVREILNDGYLKAVFENELGGRYFDTLEENAAGPGYYVSWMYSHIFIYWLWFLPVSFISGLMSQDVRLRNYTLYNLILTISYFAFITIAKTKLYWYAVPLLPLLGLQIGIFLKQTLLFLNTRVKHIVALIIVGVIFVYPYYSTAKKVAYPSEYSWDEDSYPISYLLQDALHGRRSVHNNVIVYSTYDQHLKLYAKVLEEKGQHIIFKQLRDVKSGERIIVSEKKVIAEIEKTFDFELLEDTNGYRIYELR